MGISTLWSGFVQRFLYKDIKIGAREFYENFLENCILKGRPWKGEIKNKAKDGSFYFVSITIFPLIGRNKKDTKYIAIGYDITDRKTAEEKLSVTLKKLQGDDKYCLDAKKIADKILNQ